MPKHLILTLSDILACLWSDQRGASMTEYALLLAFVALATIGAISAFASEIVTLFSTPLIP